MATATESISIIDAIRDPNLFRNFMDSRNLQSWAGWMTALRALYGIPIKSEMGKNLIRECTGRDPALLPSEGFDTALFLTGRRSGKSRTSAIIGAFEAALAGHETKLSAGEQGVVAICSPTKQQSQFVRNYIRAVFDTTDMLAAEVTRETREGFDLRNNISIQILAGDYRTVRGASLVAAIVDEAAFFGYDSESKVKSDTELIRALQPGLATIGGKLIAVSTPYARKGWCWNQFQKHYGNDASSVLVWNCPSKTMNPTLRQSIIDAAYAEDPQSAKAEYGGEFRDDVTDYIPRSLIESLVVKDRKELLPRRSGSASRNDSAVIDLFAARASVSGPHYNAFVDVSGGRRDDAALAIAHKNEDRKVVVDCIRRYRPPFNPQEVIRDMAEVIKRYGIKEVTGDNFGAEFVSQAFEGCGLRYKKCEKNKSALYVELLPRLCSGEVELLDDETLINQLASLERRTRAGGKDIIDHPPGQHDDLANAVAGAVCSVSTPVYTIGVL